MLASSSYDKQVFIWEEVETVTAKEGNRRQWVKRTNFMEKEAIMDIKFAPKHWGLTLAIAVADGTVKMHTSKDLNNLTQWAELCTVKTTSLGCTSLSWNPAFDEPMMFIVGCTTQQHMHDVQAPPLQGAAPSDDNLLQIYLKDGPTSAFTLYTSAFRPAHTHPVNDVQWAPLMGRSYHMIASCSHDRILIHKVTVRDIFDSTQ